MNQVSIISCKVPTIVFPAQVWDCHTQSHFSDQSLRSACFRSWAQSVYITPTQKFAEYNVQWSETSHTRMHLVTHQAGKVGFSAELKNYSETSQYETLTHESGASISKTEESNQLCIWIIDRLLTETWKTSTRRKWQMQFWMITAEEPWGRDCFCQLSCHNNSDSTW